MPRVLPRHVEKQWGIGGVYPQFEKNLKKVRLTSPNSTLSYNENQFVGISGFDEISGLVIVDELSSLKHLPSGCLAFKIIPSLRKG
ncbi:MAG: hypothetical protein ACFHW5_07550 [Verrucomicrobiota bacterium]